MELEGVMHDDTLYLLQVDSQIVYSAELRDANDDYVRVGRYQNGQVLLDACTGAATASAASSVTSSAHDSGDHTPAAALAAFPFATDDDDHCETPLAAYQDIACVLATLAARLKKKAHELKIWDPFYCVGSMKAHLASLGYTDVHNECVDFYEARRSPPPYDVLVTNPPFSGDHTERLFDFTSRQAQPALILIPNHVYSKDFFKDVMRRVAPSSPFFIARKKRYVFESPAALRRVAKAQQLRTAPFVTLWHCFVGAAREKCIKACQKAFAGSSTVVAASSKHLPAELKSSNDQTRKRKRKKQRDRDKKRRVE